MSIIFPINLEVKRDWEEDDPTYLHQLPSLPLSDIVDNNKLNPTL